MSFGEFAIYLVHIFAVISWLGAMYFNLVLIFPSYRAGAADIRQESRMYQVQGTRAAYWLYAFIGFTLASGALLVFFKGSELNSQLAVAKVALLMMMAGCHLIGSYYIWPRIMFAMGDEARSYLTGYKLTMLVSATLGSLAILITYLDHLDVNF